jgi:hypothetical protein
MNRTIIRGKSSNLLCGTSKKSRKRVFSDPRFYKLRDRFGGMEATDARKLREFEGENARGGAGDVGEDGDLGTEGVQIDWIAAYGNARWTSARWRF